MNSSLAGQLHQRYFHRRVLHRGVRQTQKWQIHYAPQVSIFVFQPKWIWTLSVITCIIQRIEYAREHYEFHVGKVKPPCAFSLCVWQVEGHRHHSAQQVSHHSGDNEQRRHHHFSHGECCVCVCAHTHTHTPHTRFSSGKSNTHSQISLHGDKHGAEFWSSICFEYKFALSKILMFFSVCLHLQEDMEMAKYIARLFTARHKFYKQNKICAEWVLRTAEGH